MKRVRVQIVDREMDSDGEWARQNKALASARRASAHEDTQREPIYDK